MSLSGGLHRNCEIFVNLCLKLSNLPRLRQVPGGAGTEPEVCPCAAAGGPAGGGGAGGGGGGGGPQAQGLHPHHLQTAVPAVTALGTTDINCGIITIKNKTY